LVNRLNFPRHYSHTLIYGIVLALCLFLLRWLEWRIFVVQHATEVYVGAIAIFFTCLGIWLALKLAQPTIETIVVQMQKPESQNGEFEPDHFEMERLGLSRREIEVLLLIAQGLSNKEIAGQLFVSLNTIKSHSSRLFDKLDVSSRTQAVEKGRRLLLIP
jgi:two-component system, NarL family, response regulator LiaR